MKVYGIPNCNTVKKTIDWLRDNKIDFEFYDFKKKGIDAATLKEWSEELGWEKLVNKKGTTWKKLSPEEQEKVTSEEVAINLMQEKTSVIKRPVIEADGKLLIGFNEEECKNSLKK